MSKKVPPSKSIQVHKNMRERHTRDMRLKRRAPHLYINDSIDVAKEIRGNPFNQVLKHSLLEPTSARSLSMRKQSHEVSKPSNSLSAKKSNLMRVRNLSINTNSQELDCLSLQKTFDTSRKSNIKIVPEYNFAQSLSNNISSTDNLRRGHNQSSSIDVARIVLASQEETRNPGRKINNGGLSGRFFRSNRPAQQ